MHNNNVLITLVTILTFPAEFPSIPPHGSPRIRSTILRATSPGDVIQLAGLGNSLIQVLPQAFRATSNTLTKEQIMISAVSVRPTSFYFYAGGTFMNYKSGIYDPAIDCWPLNGTVNHAMVAMGYNLTAPVPYWIVRNSWNTG